MEEVNVKSIIISILQNLSTLEESQYRMPWLAYVKISRKVNRFHRKTSIYQLLTKTTNEHRKANRLRNSPMVGMVVTISPSLSLQRMVVLPAASRPTIRIRISFLAKSRLNSFVNVSPISGPGYGSLHIFTLRFTISQYQLSSSITIRIR